MATGKPEVGTPLVEVSAEAGIVLIPTATPLTRLNYYDGLFVRAAHLDAEQRYVRELVACANRGLGAGVVYGYDLDPAGGDSVRLGPGLAVDALGRPLLLTGSATFRIADLIEKSRRPIKTEGKPAAGTGPVDFGDCVEIAAPPPTAALAPGDLFVIVIELAEALYGESEIYGRLCEKACATASDCPWRVEGIVVRAVPLVLSTDYPTSRVVALDAPAFLRSKVAHSYFADEVLKHPHALSRDGLSSATWCHGAGYDASCAGVPIAVVARQGTSNLFVDPWIARRERMETPARTYWQWKTWMRPWSVFMAQVLQFQCQLHELVQRVSSTRDADPCAAERTLTKEAAGALQKLMDYYKQTTARFKRLATTEEEPALPTIEGGLAEFDSVHRRLVEAKGGISSGIDRVLIRGGIIELPSAGYLPVVPRATVTVNTQVRQLLGEGVDLRFCVVPRDFVPHAFEEAQHMERISLVEGLDRPDRKPKVDILVPDGTFQPAAAVATGLGFDGGLWFVTSPRQAVEETSNVPTASVRGAGRAEKLARGGAAFHFAGVGEAPPSRRLTEGLNNMTVAAGPQAHGNYASLGTEPVEARAPEGYLRVAEIARTARIRRTIDETERRGGSIKFEAGLAANEALPSETRGTLAVWLTMQCDADPFELDANDVSRLSGRAVVVVPTTKPIVLDLGLEGRFTLSETATGSQGATRVRGTLNVVGTLSRATGGNQADHARHVVTTAEVRLVGSRAAGSLEIDVPIDQEADLHVVAGVEWNGSPIAAGADVSLVTYGHRSNEATTRKPPHLAKARLTEDADVLKAGDETHGMALAALDTIALVVRDEPDFRAAAERALFPPAATSGGEAQVQATRDWVLFHRRRTKQCAPVAEAPTVVPPRGYRVFRIGAQEALSAEKIFAILSTGGAGDLLRRKLMRPVGRIEYEGGLAVLRTNAQAVADDWEASTPGNTADLAIIATPGTADDPVEKSRLLRYAQIIGPTSDTSHIVLRHLADVPAGLGVQDPDGAIIVVTENVVATQCHDVFRVDKPDMFQNLSTRLERGMTAEDLVRVATHLGRVMFKQGRRDVADDSLQKLVSAWKETGSEAPTRAASVVRDGTANDVVALYRDQTRLIVRALGATLDPGQLVSHGDLPTDCPTLTIVTVDVRTRKALLVYSEGNKDSHFVEKQFPHGDLVWRNDVPQGSNLADFMTILKAGSAVLGVTLATTKTDPDLPNANTRLEAVLAAMKTANLRNVPGMPQPTLKISQHDMDLLRRLGWNPDGYDEVIFFEVMGPQ